jgi:hypothetical protein
MLYRGGDMTSVDRLRLFSCAFLFSLAAALAAQPASEKSVPSPAVSRTQRELGVVILRNVSVKDGILSFWTPSGGCTDNSSFKVGIAQGNGIADKVAHYVLTIERIKPDDCKAFFPDGELIEFDLQKDLGLNGVYVISIANPIAPKSGLLY